MTHLFYRRAVDTQLKARRKEAIERVEDYQLSRNLGWRTLHAEPAARFKTGEGPSPHKAKKHTSRPIIQLNLVGNRGPQVKANLRNPPPQSGTLARNQHEDRSGVHIHRWAIASFGCNDCIYIWWKGPDLARWVSGTNVWRRTEPVSPVFLDRFTHVFNFEADCINARLMAGYPC